MPDRPQARAARPLIYAHRGGAALRPENTIEAFDHGLALGADGLEFDVHLSRDGACIVLHDPTLERTTEGRGHVVARTVDELRRLDAGYWFRAGNGDYPYRGCGICVPLLRDVLARYRGVPIIAELKQNIPELAHRAIDEIRAANALEHVALGSYGWRVLRAAREYEPRIATGACREETRWALYRSWVGLPLKNPSYREFQVPERSGGTTVVSRRFVRFAHRGGVPVKVWTVNEADDMRRLVDWGVDALISDRPDLAVAVINERWPSARPPS